METMDKVIDVDIEPSKRNLAKSWFYDNEKLNACEILTCTRLAYKGACDVISRVYKFDKPTSLKFKEEYGNIREELDLNLMVDEINIGEDMESEDEQRFIDSGKMRIEELQDRMAQFNSEFREAIKDAVLIEGCMMAIGTHPAGVLVTDKSIDIESYIGTITMEDKQNEGNFKIVSQCNMKELEAMGYVKADALGLSNVGALARHFKSLNMKFPKTSDIDFYDEKVWKDLEKSPSMIFQFENEVAHNYLIQALSQVETKDKLQTMSMMSGLIRPSGASLRKEFINGGRGDNGHPAVDKLFSKTLGYCIYQEDISDFLSKFCGYTYAKADITRKLIAKKDLSGKFQKNMKIIEEDFKNYFPTKYEATQEQMDLVISNFLEVVENAQRYSFSYNHSIAYTMLGYLCAYERYYNTIAYITANLNEFSSKKAKLKEIYNFINNFTDIKIEKPKYPHCSLEYTFNKDTNIIYEGMSGAKSVGRNVEDAFASIPSDFKPSDIIDVWVYMKDNGISGAGRTEFLSLNKMGFFNNLGGQVRNNEIIERLTGKAAKYKYSPTQKKDTGIKKIEILREDTSIYGNDNFSDLEQAVYDLEIFGHTDKRFSELDDVYYVLDCQKPFSKYLIKLYNISNGEIVTFNGRNIKKPEKDSVIQVEERELKPDYMVSGTHSDGSPKFAPNGEKSWNILKYNTIKI